MEIERKWLVDPNKVNHLKKQSYYYEHIDQYYLNDSNDTWLIRLRKTYDGLISNFFLTLKSKGLLSREEIEMMIPYAKFDECIKHAKASIKKVRYTVECDSEKSFEIDEYDDYDFITCELEFTSEEDANAFVAPDWCIKDITNDPYYKNVNLAK